MAELTTLDEKLAEVLGLAQAAQTATKKVATLARKEKDTELLEQLNKTASDKGVAGVVKFALPLQRTHVGAIREHALRLAGEEDPSQPA